MRRILAIFLCAASLCLMGACAAETPPAGGQKALPTPVPYAPVGDASAVRTTSGILYFLSADETRLVPTLRTAIEVMPGETVIEALLGELLGNPEEGLNPVFPQGSNAYVLDVEQSQDVVTVNLSAANPSTVANMSRYYAARAAITNTLTEVRGVRFVNVLFDGRVSPLQMLFTTPNTPLPTGSMTRVSEDIAAGWLAYDSELIQLTGKPGATIKRFVTLYFASPDGKMLVPEVRELTLSYDNIVQPLIEELARGPSDPGTARRTLPSGVRLFTQPELTYTGSGRAPYVDLSFSNHLDQFIQEGELSEDIIYASLIRTLVGFVPQLEGIRVAVNGRLITSVGDTTLPEGVMNRSTFPGRVGRLVEIYYPRADGRVRMSTRVMPQEEAALVRNWLSAVIAGPLEGEIADQTLIPFPNNFSADDIKGIVFNGDTAVVNLSPDGAARLSGMDAATERAVVFSLVNTVAGAQGINWVRILVEETPVESLSGSISLLEPLLMHPGLIVNTTEMGESN